MLARILLAQRWLPFILLRMAGMQQVQNLSMQQTLAPQLQQSLQILQVPMLELRALIQAELSINPVIEEERTEPSLEDKQREMDEFQQEFDHLAKLDEEWREYMAQSSAYSGRSQEDEERRQFFFDSLVGQETLQAHLLEQLQTSDLAGDDRKIAEMIIGNIDDLGFLQVSVDEMSQNTGIEPGVIQAALEVIQTFHPVGVGARDLRDCLLIQLRRLGKEGGMEYRIVSSHLEDLGKRRFPEIARKLGTTVDQIQRCANFIGSLDPKPGQIFTANPNNYVLPDVAIEKAGGDWQVSLNGDQIPHLRISNTYKDLMAQDGNQAEVRDYPGQDPQRQVSHQEHPPAAADDFQHRSRDPRPADGVFRARADGLASFDDGADCRCCRCPRDDGKPRHFRQVCLHSLGGVRDEIFLHPRLQNL
jgi:RNA polymerase sigma-54 factor